MIDFSHDISEPHRSLKHHVYENRPDNRKGDHGIHDTKKDQTKKIFCPNVHKQVFPLAGLIDHTLAASV